MERLMRSVAALLLLLAISLPAVAADRAGHGGPRAQATAVRSLLAPLGRLLAWIGHATGVVTTSTRPGVSATTGTAPGTGTPNDGGGGMDPDGIR
jgi:hypothetical protein